MLTIFLILGLIALICTIAAILNRAPLYVAVLLLVLMELLRAIPLGR
jgi:NADH:ubiquinone oxidoreductase subunit 6 (subunit J)